MVNSKPTNPLNPKPFLNFAMLFKTKSGVFHFEKRNYFIFAKFALPTNSKLETHNSKLNKENG